MVSSLVLLISVILLGLSTQFFVRSTRTTVPVVPIGYSRKAARLARTYRVFAALILVIFSLAQTINSVWLLLSVDGLW